MNADLIYYYYSTPIFPIIKEFIQMISTIKDRMELTEIDKEFLKINDIIEFIKKFKTIRRFILTMGVIFWVIMVVIFIYIGFTYNQTII